MHFAQITHEKFTRWSTKKRLRFTNEFMELTLFVSVTAVENSTESLISDMNFSIINFPHCLPYSILSYMLSNDRSRPTFNAISHK
jgi:hypothetical protein